MKRVEFTRRTGYVYERGEVLICDDETARKFTAIAKISEYEAEKKLKEVTTNGK